MRKAAKERGVTLIELLVALSIIGLAASIAIISAPPPHGPARAEADRFAARVAAATDETIIAGRPLSLEVSRGGYAFTAYAAGKWVPVADNTALKPRHVAKGVSMSVNIADPALANEPQAQDKDAEANNRRVIFDPLGLGGAFTADFADGRESWRVSYDGKSDIEVNKYARPAS